MELFETHGTFWNPWNFFWKFKKFCWKPMELYKTDGTKNRWNFFESKKKRWNFSIGFWWIKNILLPVPAFTDKITMNVTVIAKTLLSCISHIELRIFFCSQKSSFAKSSLIPSVLKIPWVWKKFLGFQKVPSVLNSIGFKIPWV